MISVNLDESLFKKLESLSKKKGTTIHQYIAELVEEHGIVEKEPALERFSQKIHDLGAHIENPWTLLAELESEAYLKLYPRK